MRRGDCSIHGSYTTSAMRRSFSNPGPRSGEVTRACGRSGGATPTSWRTVTPVSYAGVTVGIDIGTTSVKAVAADPGGRILDRVRVPHPMVVPTPDRFEHDANRA